MVTSAKRTNKTISNRSKINFTKRTGDIRGKPHRADVIKSRHPVDLTLKLLQVCVSEAEHQDESTLGLTQAGLSIIY